MLHDVGDVFRELTQLRTRLWISKSALNEVSKFRRKGDPDGPFWKKVLSCCKSGFEGFEHTEPPIIKLEWGGVYRFGTRSSLFRLVGFYDDGKRSFIVIDAWLKKGQSLNASERQRISEVVNVKNHNLWRKVGSDGLPRNS